MAVASFVHHIHAGRTQHLYLVRGYDKGNKAWYYLRVDRPKLPLFTRALKAPSIHLPNYGEVLYTGWGEDPPVRIKQKIAKYLF